MRSKIHEKNLSQLLKVMGSTQSNSLQLIWISLQISGCPTRHTPASPAGRVTPSPSRTTLGPPVQTSSSCSPGGLAWCSGDQVLKCSGAADKVPASTTCCCLAEWREPRPRRGWSLGTEAGAMGEMGGMRGPDGRSQRLSICSHAHTCSGATGFRPMMRFNTGLYHTLLVCVCVCVSKVKERGGASL